MPEPLPQHRGSRRERCTRWRGAAHHRRLRAPPRPYVDRVEPRRGGTRLERGPRGLLYHRYGIDESGKVASALIVPPTSQNQAAIEADLAGNGGRRGRRARRRGADGAVRACDPQPRPVHPCATLLDPDGHQAVTAAVVIGLGNTFRRDDGVRTCGRGFAVDAMRLPGVRGGVRRRDDRPSDALGLGRPAVVTSTPPSVRRRDRCGAVNCRTGRGTPVSSHGFSSPRPTNGPRPRRARWYAWWLSASASPTPVLGGAEPGGGGRPTGGRPVVAAGHRAGRGNRPPAAVTGGPRRRPTRPCAPSTRRRPCPAR